MKIEIIIDLLRKVGKCQFSIRFIDLTFLFLFSFGQSNNPEEFNSITYEHFNLIGTLVTPTIKNMKRKYIQKKIKKKKNI